ncbi:hypothetical protein Lesp02_68410 [Lentzea sp. NBRC 105346]|uniref:hypothetical protein n=1 Tax=Lentzea sp. NBRC 105346 TaxID=3032205 RepID=UPI0024A2CE03|nr:hypothetical protein [Lentzea sp. NBRC 105346]GLZ34654.1 hypothetical protein Lesp02_68410 [Lentzea sp. NBRC 105346]
MLTEEIPPEAFLEGPPPDDLLLQRTLGTVRAERSRAVRRRGRLAAATTATLIAATLAGGVFLGQDLGSSGPRLFAGGTASGPRMSVQMTSTDGGVHLVATVSGIADGEKCWLVVHTKDGRAITAGSWLSHDQSVTLPVSAMVSGDDVSGVSVVSADKHPLVTAHATA